MARQLAAFPKKQFDMYRTKPRGLVSGEFFSIAPPTLHNKGKAEHSTTTSQPKDIDVKDVIVDISKDTIDMDLVSVTPTKSNKKKSKKKKKKTAAPTSLSNIEQVPPIDRERDSNLCIENKKLDSDESCSRVAKMNTTMVVDISVTPFMESNALSTDAITDSTIDNSSDHRCMIDDNHLENEGTENMDCLDSKDIEDLDNINHYSDPPFGYPLSTEKLIQSAIELLSCEPSNDGKITDLKPKEKKQTEASSTDSSSFSVNSPLETEISVEWNSSLNSPPELNIVSIIGNESVDGDNSDEGWQQSHGRRSHRKKKKEFTARERSNSNQTNKINYQEENKPNNFKRQNLKNVHNRKIGTKSNSPQEQKMATMQGDKKDVEKHGSGVENGANYDSRDNGSKGVTVSEVDGKPVFSYRDALLKAKPKNTGVEELQYNSDSGVDVNSVGSCDSAIHSPKMPQEFDLEEAVTFLMKGWNEVKELSKQGKVVYFSDDVNPLQASKNKKPFKKHWHPRTKHNK